MTPMASDRFDSDERDDYGTDRSGSFRRSRDDRGAPRERRRDDDRGRFRDRRDDDRGRSRDRSRVRERYDDDYRGNRYDDRRDRGFNPRDRNRRCNHCDRCPIHGSRPVREYPSDKFKIVFDNIPQCTVSEIENLCKDKGLDPVYAKITRNSKFAIVEFANFEDRDSALEKLNNIEFNGTTISVREFRPSGLGFNEKTPGSAETNDYSAENDRSEEQPDKRRRIQNDVDIYADIEDSKPEKGEFDV